MTTLANQTPLNLGADYVIDNGLVIDTRDFFDSDGHEHKDGDLWEYQGVVFWKRGDWLMPTAGQWAAGSMPLELLKQLLNIHAPETRKPVFKGRVVATVKGHYADWSMLSWLIGQGRQAMTMPTWYLAEHSIFTEQLIDAYESGRVQLEPPVVVELLKTLLEHEALKDWEHQTPQRGLSPVPDIEDDDSGEPYFEVSPISRGLVKAVEQTLEAVGMDSLDLSEAAGLDREEFQFLMAGQAEFTASEVFRVAEILGVTAGELLRCAEIFADEEESK